VVLLTLENQLKEIENKLETTKNQNGWISKTWDWFKNTTGIGASSDKVQSEINSIKKQIEELKKGNTDLETVYKNITGKDLTNEELSSFINGETNLLDSSKVGESINKYSEGQKMCTDIVADVVSGIVAIGAAAAAPFTGGASLLVAGAVGAGLKVAIKASDCIGNNKKYELKDGLYDTATGFVNGLMGPLTNGLGGAAGTSVAKAFGLKAVESTAKEGLEQAIKFAGKEVIEEGVEQVAKTVAKEAIEEGVEQGVKQAGKSTIAKILAKQGSEYILEEGAEKTLKTSFGKFAAYGVDMMVDGSLSGAADGAIRAVAEGRPEDILSDTVSGFAGGLIMSPIIGGSMRGATKLGGTVLNKINNKITIRNILPDGSNTKFSQGEVGDCAFLSMFDGMLNNKTTFKQLQNSILTDTNGNISVNIGGKTVTVAREALTDEILADKSGVKLFEAAYKQLIGDDALDGGFADVVAKNLGLNPIHIEGDALTDDVFEQISKEQDNAILSLGLKVNDNGVVDVNGTNQHYFSIKNVDTEAKTLTLVDTYDTSKTITMTFDDVKTQGISIDGGSIKKTNLPNIERTASDTPFKGIQQITTPIQNYTPEEKTQILLDKGVDSYQVKDFISLDDTQFSRVEKLLDKGVYGSYVKNIAALDDTQFARAEKLLDKGVDGYYVKNIAALDDTQFARAEKLLDKGVGSYQVENIAKLSDKQYQRFSDLTKAGIDTYNAIKIATLDNGQFTHYEKLINTGIDIDNALKIATLTEFELKNYEKYIQDGLSPEIAVQYAPDSYYGIRRDRLIELSKRGLDHDNVIMILNYSDEKIYSRTVNLLENGIDIEEAISGGSTQREYDELIEKINSSPNAMRDLLNSDNYMAKLNKATQGKYQKELNLILDPASMPFKTRKALLESGLTEDEFFESIKKLSTSTYKLAMGTPNQYLSDIDIKYTTKVNGKYPQLPDEVLKQQQKQINDFFAEHMAELTRALKYIDADTLNQMMDKRTAKFAESLTNLNNLKDENFKLLSDLTQKCKAPYTNAEKQALIAKRAKSGKPLNDAQIKTLNEQTTRNLTAREKIQLCQIVEIYQKVGIDKSSLSKMITDGEVDLNYAKQSIQKEILKAAGIKEEDISKISIDKLKFNEEYSYLALQKAENILEGEEGEQVKEALRNGIQEIRNMDKDLLDAVIKQSEELMNSKEFALTATAELRTLNEKMLDIYKNPDKYSDDEIYEIMLDSVRVAIGMHSESDQLNVVIRESVLGDFSKFITDESNIYGQANAKTATAFAMNGINYEQWLKPDIEDVKLMVNDQEMTIKMWDRNPQEDLFMGNKTSCCTAIGTGGNAAATPVYLLNTSYNVVELFDETGDVVGMSRIFMANVDGKPSIIMDNIELNTNYKDTKASNEVKTKIRNGFFEYMNKYAEHITSDPNSQVYFYSGDIHVPNSDLKHQNITLDFIGSLSQETVYVNSAGCSWIDPTKIAKNGSIDFLVVPKKK
ncbi:hypothetical protein IJD44_01450, partial [bacterium]|nr:hypothetical protein [bacterium]